MNDHQLVVSNTIHNTVNGKAKDDCLWIPKHAELDANSEYSDASSANQSRLSCHEFVCLKYCKNKLQTGRKNNFTHLTLL